MSRRKFLIGIGSAAVAASPRILLAGKSRLSVGIVGGGIISASIALHLSRAGADVTLVEKTALASGATSKSFAWLNAFSGTPHYRDLRLRSLSAWHELDRQLQLDITWGGSLLWHDEGVAAQRLSASARKYDRAGYRMEILDTGKFAALAPNLAPGPFESAVHAGLDGHLDPVLVTRKILDHAEKQGAQIRCPCEVTDLAFSGSRLSEVITTEGKYFVDRLVIAAGVDTSDLAAKVDCTVPLKHAPGILAHSVPIRPLTKFVAEHQPVYFKQTSDGRIIGTDSSYAPDTPVHRKILAGQRGFPSDELRSVHGSRILDKIATLLPGARGAALQRLTLGFRPLPKDGFPITGFIPGVPDVYVAVMHSGITLAAIMGQLISREILDDSLLDTLAPYRPGRFVE